MSTRIVIHLAGVPASGVTTVSVATPSGTKTFTAGAAGFSSSDGKSTCLVEAAPEGFPGPTDGGGGSTGN